MATHQHHASHKHHRRIAVGIALAAGASFLAPTFAATSGTWDRLAQCESGQRWNINTGNGYYGGLQFSSGTWRAYGGREFGENAHLATRVQQITVAERLLADRGWGPWPACSTKLRLTAADALGNPFPGVPAAVPTNPNAPAPSTSAPPTADAATVLAAAERKAVNTAARAVKKQAEADAAKLAWERAVRNARKAPPEQWAARAPKVTRLQNAATVAAETATKAKADADRAARKLRAARAAAGVTP